MQNRLFNINTKRRSCTTASASVVSAGNSGRCIAATLTVGLTNVTLLLLLGSMHAPEFFLRDENPTSSARVSGGCYVDTPALIAYRRCSYRRCSKVKQRHQLNIKGRQQHSRHAYIARPLRQRERRLSTLTHKFGNRLQVFHEYSETVHIRLGQW